MYLFRLSVVYKKQKSISGWVFRFWSSDICYMCTMGTCLCSYVECVNIDIKVERWKAFFLSFTNILDFFFFSVLWWWNILPYLLVNCFIKKHFFVLLKIYFSTSLELFPKDICFKMVIRIEVWCSFFNQKN